MIEAESRRHATLDTGHILLGLVALPDAAAVTALSHLGVTADVVREATVRLLDAEFAAGSLAIEVSAATDDLLLRAYQHSLARESPNSSLEGSPVLVGASLTSYSSRLGGIFGLRFGGGYDVRSLASRRRSPTWTSSSPARWTRRRRPAWR